MTVRVLLFASYADVLGASSLELDVADGSTVRDLVTAVRSRAPGSLPPNPLVAVNNEYAGPDERVTAADEVALIPPVAGG